MRLPNWFSLCPDSDKKILPLCYKHVIAMSSRKIGGNLTSLCFQSCLKFVLSWLHCRILPILAQGEIRRFRDSEK